MNKQLDTAMTMTSEDIEVTIILKFGKSGVVCIDWGDGKIEEIDFYTHSLLLSSAGFFNSFHKTCALNHTYSNKSAHTITITGEDIMGMACGENQLTNLDVSKNIALTKLWCFKNKLTNLDISKNHALIELECWENKLTNLDVSKNSMLEKLWCFRNKITNLNLGKNEIMKELYYEKEPKSDICDKYRMFG